MSVYYIVSHFMELSKCFDSDGCVPSIPPEIEGDEALNISIQDKLKITTMTANLDNSGSVIQGTTKLLHFESYPYIIYIYSVNEIL